MANKIIQLDDGSNSLFPRHKWFSNTRYQAYFYDASNGTKTFTLTSGQVYLMVITRMNSGSTGNSGLYVIQAHSVDSSVRAIASSAVATVSVNELTLTVTTTSNYCNIELIPLRDI